MAVEKKTKTVSPSPAKETPVVKEAAPKKVAAEKAAAKAAPKKTVAKAAPKKAAPAKTAAQKAAETLVIQAAGNEWDIAAVKEQAIAAYVAEGHQRSGITSLTVYIKPEERKAYYVINDKTGSVDI